MKQKPLRLRFRVFDQQAMDADGEIEQEKSYKDDADLEKHRRWVYLMKKREEEKEE